MIIQLSSPYGFAQDPLCGFFSVIQRVSRFIHSLQGGCLYIEHVLLINGACRCPKVIRGITDAVVLREN